MDTKTTRVFRGAHPSRVPATVSRRRELFEMRSQPMALSIFAAASRILKDRGQFTP
jgi:hypothetical protein